MSDSVFFEAQDLVDEFRKKTRKEDDLFGEKKM